MRSELGELIDAKINLGYRLLHTMFTGIVQSIQSIQSIIEINSNKRFIINRPLEWKMKIGESVNVDGVCSTVVSVDDNTFSVEYMPESLLRTTLDAKEVKNVVNLEQSLTLQNTLSGHFVYGHVDTTARIKKIKQEGGSHVLTLQHNSKNDKYIIQKGSITLNGISLTVINPTKGQFSVSIIPYTWEQTTMQNLKEGDAVNIEYDMIAKYIEKILQTNG